MNHRQLLLLQILRMPDQWRDVYEAADARDTFYVTYRQGHRFEPLNYDEVLELVRLGYLEQKGPPHLLYFTATKKART